MKSSILILFFYSLIFYSCQNISTVNSTDYLNYMDGNSLHVEPIGGVERMARILKYPKVAIEEKTEGKVLVETFINEEGEVEKTVILQSLSPECDFAAGLAVRKTKFIPLKINGKPVKVRVTIPIVFKL